MSTDDHRWAKAGLSPCAAKAPSQSSSGLLATGEGLLPHAEITEAVIGAAFEVHGSLGYGFLEAVYRNAMAVELALRGRRAEIEKRIEVLYKGKPVGLYVADMLVDDVVLVEFKVAEEYRKADEAQLLNELAATDCPLGLLINFGRHKVQFKRLAWNLGKRI